MKWVELLQLVKSLPFFTTSLLSAEVADLNHLQQQLVRWEQTEKLIQLRRGIYLLAPPYRSVEPHPFVLANALHTPSYVSLQAALGWHGMIPEYVHTVTSITTNRPIHLATEAGAFTYRHIKTACFMGYQTHSVAEGQNAYIATPEKALLDLIYLTPGADTPSYIQELRLQHMESFDMERAFQFAEMSGKPKLSRALSFVAEEKNR